MITLVFSTGIGILFLLSGFSKVVALRESVASIKKLKLFSDIISTFLGLTFPFFEVALAILIILYKSSLIVNLVALCITVVFMLINYKMISDRKKISCFCFGNIIKTELGYGGLTQSFLMLGCFLLNIIITSQNSLLLIKDIELKLLILYIVTSILWTITLLLIRSTIDLLYRIPVRD
ncbi:MauE/DoxX family redox-associated membrane protein [Bacillus sp. F56]|uniref:MauE/DoxX family redox-associated membrane protein n=1 Tax=Bacillus sp. F56 TaxID=1581850 RepID=UPI0009F28753|nr:MauE/DoxX family redox-associated membrane protein [Bacillus sp. F56]